MPVRLRGANPSREAETVYSPTATEGAEKVPPPAVRNLRSLPVSSLRMSTCAWGIAAPPASTTSPEIVPPTICAGALGATVMRRRRYGKTSRNVRIIKLLEFCKGKYRKQLAATTKAEATA